MGAGGAEDSLAQAARPRSPWTCRRWRAPADERPIAYRWKSSSTRTRDPGVCASCPSSTTMRLSAGRVPPSSRAQRRVSRRLRPAPSACASGSSSSRGMIASTGAPTFASSPWPVPARAARVARLLGDLVSLYMPCCAASTRLRRRHRSAEARASAPDGCSLRWRRPSGGLDARARAVRGSASPCFHTIRGWLLVRGWRAGRGLNGAGESGCVGRDRSAPIVAVLNPWICAASTCAYRRRRRLARHRVRPHARARARGQNLHVNDPRGPGQVTRRIRRISSHGQAPS